MKPTPNLLALAAALALVALSTPARADKPYDACQAKAVTNPAYAQCGAALVEREDKRLNTVWTRVYAKLDPTEKPAFLAEQRLWLAYRDKACGYWFDNAGREGQVIHFPACRAQVIADRTALLEAVGETFGR